MKGGLVGRYVLRHARRAWAKTVLAVLLAALLAGTVGQLGFLRARYAALVDAVEVDVRFFNGLSYSKAKILEKSGYVRDPVYLKSYEAASGFYVMMTLVFTNRLDSLYSEPVTWLEGWDEESAMTANGKYCILPAPFMEEMELELGDEFRINERDVMSHLLADGTPGDVPSSGRRDPRARNAGGSPCPAGRQAPQVYGHRTHRDGERGVAGRGPRRLLPVLRQLPRRRAVFRQRGV